MQVKSNKVTYEKLYDDPSIDGHIMAASDKYNEHMEDILGIGLNMPFECTNSASRKNMFSSQYQQKVVLEHPDIPYISTGYENLFGQHSSSFIKSEHNWTVMGIINKFSNVPGHHYYIFVIDENGNMDVIERVSYCHNTESYGFLYDNKYLDSLSVGSVIPVGTTVKKSTSFDKFDNYMTGKNLRTMYVSDEDTTEDAIVISESAAKALSRSEINKITILINDNDIPLNLYGDDTVYKVIPDIGQDIQKGILCGIRTERNDEIFFTQSAERLKVPMINDQTFKTKGKIIDINVYCNKDIASSANGVYEGQLAYYDRDYKRFCGEVVELLRNYIDNSMYKKSYKLSELYTRCESVVNGKQYFKDNVFSNIILELTVYHSAPLEKGDKITSRYGGKGVISEVKPDDEMPRVHGTDDIIDLIWNEATCVNRLNPGQLFEISLNFISQNIVNYIYTFTPDAEMCIDIMKRYFSILSDDFARYFIEDIESSLNDDDAISRISDWLTPNMDGLYIPLEPISETMTFDKLNELYHEFPWIKPVYTDSPVIGSARRGSKKRFVKSKNPSIVAKQYIYRMKQNAEEKHSATSMSAINVKGLNSKSKASKMFIRVHPNTPVRWGEMENGIFDMMNPEVKIMILMLYSTSPQGRRAANQLLQSYDLNVQLDDDAKSRSVEIFNSAIKTMGLAFRFKKIPIKYNNIAQECGINQSKLFHFLDFDNDPLFIPCGVNQDKLFLECGTNQSKLFVECGENQNKLFVENKG